MAVAHTEPVLFPKPNLTSSGESVVTPYGSKLLRLTDSRDGNDCFHGYSYYRAISLDNSMVVLKCGGYPKIVRIDPVKFQRTGIEVLPPLLSGNHINPETCIWSTIHPQRLWARNGSRIYMLNVAEARWYMVRDFSPMAVVQWSISDDETMFAFRTKVDGGMFSVVYSLPADKLIWQDGPADIDECQIDKSGRFLLIKPVDPKTQPARLVDLLTRLVTPILIMDPGFGPGHSDMGFGICVHANGWLPNLTVRRLDDFSDRLSIDREDWHRIKGAHLSMRGLNDEWVLVSNNHNAVDVALGKGFTNEMYYLSTTGTRKYWRVGRHFPGNVSSNYWAIPKAVCSLDQTLILFASQWGYPDGRTDAWMYKHLPPR